MAGGASSPTAAAALVLISHDRRFLAEPVARHGVARPRRRRGGIERGFADFEAWRDEVLAEEERDRHKLDRKIVAEEHWLRYGVTARRKRNVRRLARLAGAARGSAATRAAPPARSRMTAARPSRPARW